MLDYLRAFLKVEYMAFITIVLGWVMCIAFVAIFISEGLARFITFAPFVLFFICLLYPLAEDVYKWFKKEFKKKLAEVRSEKEE